MNKLILAFVILATTFKSMAHTPPLCRTSDTQSQAIKAYIVLDVQGSVGIAEDILNKIEMAKKVGNGEQIVITGNAYTLTLKTTEAEIESEYAHKSTVELCSLELLLMEHVRKLKDGEVLGD